MAEFSLTLETHPFANYFVPAPSVYKRDRGAHCTNSCPRDTMPHPGRSSILTDRKRSPAPNLSSSGIQNPSPQMVIRGPAPTGRAINIAKS